MYRLMFILAFSLVAISAEAQQMQTLPVLAAPSTDSPAWKAYQKLLEKYYFLDNQKAAHISCRLSVPQLNEFVDAVQQKNTNEFIINNNLQDFSITYDRAKGISFNSPEFHVMPSAPGAAANAKAEELRQHVAAYFAMEIPAVILSIRGVMDELIYPDTQKRKDLSLTKRGDATIVSYDVNQKQHVDMEYSGTKKKITQSSATAQLNGVADYAPLNGKLAVTRMDVKSINTVYSLSYQDLGSTFFPERILFDVTPPKDKPQIKPIHLEINFKDCAASAAAAP